MTIIILQGPQLTKGAARELSTRLKGDLEQRADHARIAVGQRPDPDLVTTLRENFPFDINILPEDFDPGAVRLLVTDMDSTLISIECIDEIADFIGMKPQVAEITAAAMRGEIDFETSLTRRTALLRGLDTTALERVYTERLRLNDGAEALIEGLRARSIRSALVSGGFTFFTDRLGERLGFDYTLANVLDIEDGRLTGRVRGEIVGAEAKAAFMLRACDELGIPPHHAIAVGDGANDLQMMRQAGLSVAFHAKPAVQAQAHVVLNHSGLDAILVFL